MLPGFNAEVSLYPAKNIYRTYFSTSTARKSAPLQIRLADPLSHCQQLCASACASVPQNEYSFCFQSCFNGCYQPTQGPASTVGYCNAGEYQRCLNQFGNDPSLSGSCYLYYGPCGSSCCGEGANRSCTSLKTNPLNCGRCGNACVEGASCCGGSCCGGVGTNLGCCTYTGLEGTIFILCSSAAGRKTQR